MTFLAIVIVFALVQYWGSADPAHNDGWYRSWGRTVQGWGLGAEMQLLLQLSLPLLLLWWVLDMLADISSWLLFAAYIPVLLYSLGRGDFVEWVKGYTDAFHRNDNETATEYASRLGVDVSETDNWDDLHHQVLRQASYRGLERWFIAIFWFVLLGPVGAVLYRLTSLGATHEEQGEESRELSLRLMWLLEWPVARLLGLSFALTGNFVGCFSRWREHFFCVDQSTQRVMEHYVHGALNVNDQELTLDGVTEQEVEALVPLLSRSLMLWLCVLALLSLL
ncbi:histidine kinase [Pseudomaricurvus alkylphenolicus]|uniref:histidine kinase n=1 Tax=Pseudomaricurvus alkylphenolicus TaxID=1306991 RepID=UPI00141EA78E|nr:histidine kinase [Pseudomaricurvus alkylphenolicus]NIB40015.1 histidine kinase [Pseudomaricurvus alkylphenolicus]